ASITAELRALILSMSNMGAAMDGCSCAAPASIGVAAGGGGTLPGGVRCSRRVVPSGESNAAVDPAASNCGAMLQANNSVALHLKKFRELTCMVSAPL